MGWLIWVSKVSRYLPILCLYTGLPVAWVLFASSARVVDMTFPAGIPHELYGSSQRREHLQCTERPCTGGGSVVALHRAVVPVLFAICQIVVGL